ETIPGIRLVDPIVVSPTFKQLQSVKSYYAFPDALDVDRYNVDGKVRDTVLAVGVDGVVVEPVALVGRDAVQVELAHGEHRVADLALDRVAVDVERVRERVVGLHRLQLLGRRRDDDRVDHADAGDGLGVVAQLSLGRLGGRGVA